jgi:hypothetical protein
MMTMMIRCNATPMPVDDDARCCSRMLLCCSDVRQHEMPHISSASCLKLPKGHSHEDLTNKLVQLQKLGLSQIRRQYRLYLLPPASSLGVNVRSLHVSSWPRSLSLRLCNLLNCLTFMFSRAAIVRSKSSSLVRSRTVLCSGISRKMICTYFRCCNVEYCQLVSS